MEKRNCSWVTADGDYGTGVIILFEEEELHIDQWEDVTEMYDSDRLDYVEAVLTGDEKTATRLLEESGLRQG